VEFAWDLAKNQLLKNARGITFEEIESLIREGAVWKTSNHPRPAEYPNQQIFYVIVSGYIHSVPFEIRDGVIWLVTSYPSRKATQEYLRERNS
jgi:uncharacterized DUF497 family protein